jgi:hypothetical protein
MGKMNDQGGISTRWCDQASSCQRGPSLALDRPTRSEKKVTTLDRGRRSRFLIHPWKAKNSVLSR